jgi:cellulose synthase (UDP-forming)
MTTVDETPESGMGPAGTGVDTVPAGTPVAAALRLDVPAMAMPETTEQAQTIIIPRISAEAMASVVEIETPAQSDAASEPASAKPENSKQENFKPETRAPAPPPDHAQTVQIPRIKLQAEALTVPMPRIRVSPPEAPAAPIPPRPAPVAPPVSSERIWRVAPEPDEEPWRPELFTHTIKTTGAVLPTPPSRPEKYLYRTRNMWVLIIGMVMGSPFLFYSQIHLIAYSMRLWILLPVILMTPIVTIIRLFLEIGTRDFDFFAHSKLVGSWAPETYPSVDIMLPTCGESMEVLRNTWNYVAPLQRGYPGTATVYVLDDGKRSEVRTMAAEYGFRYLARPNAGWYKKAGNLNYGLQHSAGEYVLILDADFAPSHDMLAETLPYFEADRRLGILQTPQFFRNLPEQTFVERGSATSQEFFYRAIQVARDQRDAVVCCGTNAIYRRAALAQNGGITLISHSEDAHTGIDLRRRGWKVRYVPINLASGLCPADVDSFFRQQYRWCVGTISIVTDRTFWFSRIPLAARLYDLVGFLYYLETATYALLGPLITAILCLATPHQVVLRNYLLVVPSALFGFVILPLWHRVRSGIDTWAVEIVVSWAHLFALWDAVRGKQLAWRPSGAKTKRRSDNRRLWAGLWGWSLGMSALGVALAGWRMFSMNTAAFTPIFVSAVFYLAIVVKILISRWEAPHGA